MRYSRGILFACILAGCVTDPAPTAFETLVVNSPALFARSSNGVAEGRYRDTIEVTYPDSSEFVLSIDRTSSIPDVFTIKSLSAVKSRLHRLEVTIDTTVPLPSLGHELMKADLQLTGKAEGKKDGVGYATATYMLVGG